MTLVPNAYRVIVKDANGTVLLPYVDNYASLEYSRSVNNVGVLTIVLSDSDIVSTINKWEKFFVDGRIEVWRSVNGGAQYLDGETCYFIRKLERDLDEEGRQSFTITAEDTISILGRRTTLVDPKNVYVNITVAKAADDAIKDLFENTLGTNADTAYGAAGFNLSAYFAQQPDLTLAQTITKTFAGRSVLQVMQEMARASADLGTYLAFDLVTDGITFTFNTYTGQRGHDRRASTGGALMIGPQMGNVLACHYEDDHTQEATYLVNGTQAASSSEREGVGPFGRIMKVMSSSATGTTAQLLADAKAQLRFNRSKKVFTAKMIQTEGCLYGVHYGYGDYITVSAWGTQFDCHLDAVDIRIQDGEEQVNCIFRGEYQAWL